MNNDNVQAHNDDSRGNVNNARADKSPRKAPRVRAGVQAGGAVGQKFDLGPYGSAYCNPFVC